jgi:hypothetical protein
MPRFDKEFYEALNLTAAERRNECRLAIVRALGAHYPSPLAMSDIAHLYRRYYPATARAIRDTENMIRFLERMADDRLIVFEYHENIMTTILLRKGQEVRDILDLPPCLLPLTRCHERGCAHRHRCEVYVEMSFNFANDPDKEST